MSRSVLATTNEMLWARFHAAETTSEIQDAMKAIIKRLLVGPSTRTEINLAMVECGVRPVLFELGLSIVTEASECVRDQFRARLVACGAIFPAMRLAILMDCPLSRREVVALGNHHVGSITREEVRMFFDCAERTEGIGELDLRRLEKQFRADHVGNVC